MLFKFLLEQISNCIPVKNSKYQKAKERAIAPDAARVTAPMRLTQKFSAPFVFSFTTWNL